MTRLSLCTCVCLVVVGCAAFMAGCNPPAPPMGPVSGKVTLDDGKPLTEGHVSLVPVSQDQATLGMSSGQIDSSGNFTISTSGVPGAPLGKYKVTVNPPMVPRTDGKAPFGPYNTMYQQAAKSPITFEVVPTPEPDRYNLKLKK